MDHLGLLLLIVLIVAGIEIWRLMRKKRQLRLKEQSNPTPVSVTSLPAVYTLQAADASQYTGKLQEILQGLKTENRIKDFTVLDPEDGLLSRIDEIGDEDLILIVLTHQLQSQNQRIENHLRDLKANRSEVSIAEIVVDHIVYNNEYITLPADLKPFRNREDMDVAWNSIELSLKELFPAKKIQEPVYPQPTDWSQYLKIATKILGKAVAVYMILIAVAVSLILLLILALLDDTVGDFVGWFFFLTFFIALVVALFLAGRKLSGSRDQQSSESDH